MANLHEIRHSAAHVMAEAVLKLFPDAKFAIGPSIEEGFYYDFDLPRPLTDEDLPKIEKTMKKIVKSNKPFERREMTRDEAQELFKDQPYKLEIIKELPEDATISTYTQGGFTDLCRGPHVSKTKEIGAFKLLSIAGAYWRGDENRPMLQRIYGTAFQDKESLKSFLKRREEAAARDHRKLGRELSLFSIHHEEAGGGLIFWHPKGTHVRTVIEDFWRNEHRSSGYELVAVPHIMRSRLWQISGHLDFYSENMYPAMDVEGQDYLLKPMNCPGHILIYKSDLRSYRELPIRWAELGTVYRFERSGVLHGLMRVRGFTQDDAHIFMRPDQIDAEIERVIDFCLHILASLGFEEYDIYLSTRGSESKGFVGSDEIWSKATESLRRALEKTGLDFEVDDGGAAFYGPKIDIKIKDSLGRPWQCSTIQLDFNLPERFDMSYVDEDGSQKRPIMIHRALLGSIERFFGVLIEHYGGAFPPWLAPEHAVLIPIADRHHNYCIKLRDRLRARGIIARIDDSKNRMNKKIRQAQLEKIPYMLIVGDKEVESGSCSLRLRDNRDLGALAVERVIDQIIGIIEEKRNDMLWPE